eukprot:731551-Pleurochrysis_carterae.AAC.7
MSENYLHSKFESYMTRKSSLTSLPSYTKLIFGDTTLGRGQVCRGTGKQERGVNSTVGGTESKKRFRARSWHLSIAGREALGAVSCCVVQQCLQITHEGKEGSKLSGDPRADAKL